VARKIKFACFSILRGFVLDVKRRMEEYSSVQFNKHQRQSGKAKRLICIPHLTANPTPKSSPFLFLLFLRPLTDMNSISQHHARTDRCPGVMKKKKGPSTRRATHPLHGRAQFISVGLARSGFKQPAVLTRIFRRQQKWKYAPLHNSGTTYARERPRAACFSSKNQEARRGWGSASGASQAHSITLASSSTC